MKNRNRIAIVMIIILGSATFWRITKNQKTNPDREFAVEDTASITKIFLADKKGRVINLERNRGGWKLNSKYVARMDAVQSLLVTIKKVAVKEPVSKKAMNNIIRMFAGKAIRCEIYQNNKLSKAYYVGTETQDLTGTYMILMDEETMETTDQKPYVTYIPGFEGYLTTRYFTEEIGWRDRAIFNYNPNEIKSIKMEVPFKPEESFELAVNGNNNYEIKLISENKKIDKIDTMTVKQYLSYFQHLIFESFEVSISQKQIDSTIQSQPINIISVTTNNNETKKVALYARVPRHPGMLDENGKTITIDPERMDAVINNNKKEVVMVQYYSWGKVLPPVEYFKKK